MPLFADDEPRAHHYLFAHRALREVAGQVASEMPGLIESGRMDEALVRTWNRVGKSLGRRERLSAGGGLGASMQRIDGEDVVLVTMPPAEHAAEAHFVALVLQDPRPARYFVLEHGWTTTDEPRTVLCEWSEEGHLNFGDGPEPTASAFVAAVAARIS